MTKKTSIFYGYIIVAASFIIIAIGLGTNSSFGVFLEPMLNEYGWTRSSISGAFSLSQIIGGTIGIIAGRLTDKLGPRLVLTASALFLGAGYLLMPLVHSPWQLYLFYGLLSGIGIAGPVVPLYTTTIRWFNRHRALMVGIVSAGMSTGTIIVSQLAGWLISIRDWRFAFTIIGIINLVIIGVAAQFLKRDPQSIGQLPYGNIDNIDSNDKQLSKGFTLRQALSDRQFWVLFTANLLTALAIFTVIAHIVIHATGLQISRFSAVSLLTYISITSALSRMVMGNTAEKFGNRRTITIGMALMSVSLVWLLFSSELWMLILFSLVFGFAWGTFFTPVTPLTAELFGLESLGVISGSLNISITFGATIGPVLAGYIYDIQKSYRPDFIMLVVTTFVAAVLMLTLRRNRKAKK